MHRINKFLIVIGVFLFAVGGGVYLAPPEERAAAEPKRVRRAPVRECRPTAAGEVASAASHEDAPAATAR